MKKLLIATMISLFAVGITASSYAATDQPLYTTVSASVGEVFNISFGAPGVAGPGEKARSSTSFAFKAVDGTSPSGWYYNNTATLDGTTGDPIDGKSDVAIVCKSNVLPYYLKIEKDIDLLDGKIGYHVDKAFDCSAPTAGTEADGAVTEGDGFAGTSGDGWGAIPNAAVVVYTSGTNIYATHGVLIPISFALVPAGLPAATSPAYSTKITYTLTPSLT